MTSTNHGLYLIYGKDGCTYCDKAKKFAEDNGINYEYLTLGVDYKKEHLIDKCYPVKPKTVPQIFRVAEGLTTHVGGADDFISYFEGEK